MEGLRLDAGLADAATRESLAGAMGVGAGDRGMCHPDLLAGPALDVAARRHCEAEKRPWRAIWRAAGISEIRRQVPPFNAIGGMRAVIGGKGECLAGCDGRISVRALAEPGETLCERRRASEAE